MQTKGIKVKFLLLIGVLLIINMVSSVIKSPYFYLNTSKSLPIGIYVVKKITPGVGDLVVIDLADHKRKLLLEKNITKTANLLLKPIIATSGDFVCSKDQAIIINHKIILQQHKDLSLYAICRTLNDQEFFVGIVSQNNSLDSRYFGLITNKEIKSVVSPLIIFNKNKE